MTQGNPMVRKLRTAGIFIIIGLVVEAISLAWNNPLSFVAFLGIGGLFLAIGILVYLWSLVSYRQEEGKTKSEQG